jgi:hypothetical protein
VTLILTLKKLLILLRINIKNLSLIYNCIAQEIQSDLWILSEHNGYNAGLLRKPTSSEQYRSDPTRFVSDSLRADSGPDYVRKGYGRVLSELTIGSYRIRPEPAFGNT